MISGQFAMVLALWSGRMEPLSFLAVAQRSALEVDAGLNWVCWQATIGLVVMDAAGSRQ